MKDGIVYIVGAGPGDPKLITVYGLECIQKADVIAYDRLVNPKLLDFAKRMRSLFIVANYQEASSHSRGNKCIAR